MFTGFYLLSISKIKSPEKTTQEKFIDYEDYCDYDKYLLTESSYLEIQDKKKLEKLDLIAILHNQNLHEICLF